MATVATYGNRKFCNQSATKLTSPGHNFRVLLVGYMLEAVESLQLATDASKMWCSSIPVEDSVSSRWIQSRVPSWRTSFTTHFTFFRPRSTSAAIAFRPASTSVEARPSSSSYAIVDVRCGVVSALRG